MMKCKTITTTIILILSAIFLAGNGAAAIGTAFSYQGQLLDNDEPASGTYDFQFKLYDAETGGTQWGSTVTVPGKTVENGLFTAVLDFGYQYLGDPRWLQIEVRASGEPSYSVLEPRQRLFPTPAALFAQEAQAAYTAESAANATTAFNLSGTLGSSSLTGTYSQAVTLSNSGNTFTGNGSGLTSLNAGQITAGTLSNSRLSSTVGLTNVSKTYTSPQTFNEPRISSSGDLYLVGGTDINHGLGYYTGTFSWKPFGDAVVINGPVLYGYSGGALGVTNGYHEILVWKDSGRVGIGTTNPQAELHVVGDLRIDGGIVTNAKTSFASVAAGAFQPENNGTSYSIISAAWVYTNDLPSCFYAPVQLPHGAVVNRVSWKGINALEGAVVELTLYRMNFNQVYEAMAYLAGNGAGSLQHDESINYATVDNENYQYYLRMDFDGGTCYGSGVSIRYTYTEP
ncbi:MAG: hypothetical protein ACP5I4_10370 [Oceanipulchritudo sp.]